MGSKLSDLYQEGNKTGLLDWNPVASTSWWKCLNVCPSELGQYDLGILECLPGVLHWTSMDISIRWVEWSEYNMAHHPVSSVNGALSNWGSGTWNKRWLWQQGVCGCLLALLCIAEETEGWIKADVFYQPLACWVIKNQDFSLLV